MTSYIEERPFYGGLISNTTAIQQGRIVRNAEFDYDRYKTNLADLEKVSTGKYHLFYDVSLTESSVTILQGDTVFRQKACTDDVRTKFGELRYEGGAGDNGHPKIFGSLNGMGFYDLDGNDSYIIKDKSGSNLLQFKHKCRGMIEFMGLAQGFFNINPAGINAENNRIDLSLQTGGIETITNRGPYLIRSGDYVVWDVPDPTQLNSYPPRTKNSMPGYSAQTIFASTEPYDITREFNLNNLFKAHIKTFDKCQHFDFGNADTNVSYLPKNFNSFETDFSLEGFHKCLFGFLFAVCAIADVASTEVYTMDENSRKWDNPIKPADIQKILKGAQGILYQTTNDRYYTEENRLRSKKILMTSLIALEASFFSNETDIYRSNGMKPVDTYEIKGLLGKSVEGMMHILSNITHEQRKRIIGRALTSADPGDMFDIFLGNVYSF